MEKTTLTIQEILEGRKLVTMQEIKKNTGKEGTHKGTRELVRVTAEGTVSEDETMRWYHFEMDGIPCVYIFPEKKFLKIVKKINAPVLTLEEALEGRQQVTLNEVKAYTGEENPRKSITDMVEITNQGISESGVRWYHFEMGGMPCVYTIQRKKKKETVRKMEKKVLTLEEALEGRRKVTLDEVRERVKKGNRHALREMVKITEKGITENGRFLWYHFEMDGMPCVYIKKSLSICKTNKMTEPERKFAEDNIGLFKKFFSLMGFKEEECHDAAMWGYLISVVKYHRDKETRKYAFSTIAYKTMYEKCIVCRSRILKEKAKTCSLEKMREEKKEDGLLYGYIDNLGYEEDRLKEVMADIKPYINAQQKTLLKLIHAGYNFGEIRGICGWSYRKERTIRNGIIETAKRYYSKAI